MYFQLKLKHVNKTEIWLRIRNNLSRLADVLCRASQGEKADSPLDSQVLQYEPAHHGSINTVTNLSPDLCVSGGSDQVNMQEY